MTQTTPSFTASADIPISVFVKITSGTDHNAQACVAGDTAIGVSDYCPQDPVLPGGSVGPAATAGNPIRIFTLGETCEVLAGGTITAGQFLKPDANGKAVACSASDKFSAIARAGASANQLCKVLVEIGVAP